MIKIATSKIIWECPEYTVTSETTEDNQLFIHISKIKDFSIAIYEELLELFIDIKDQAKEDGYKQINTMVPRPEMVKFATRFGFMPKSVLANVDTGETFILMSQEVG